MQRILDAARDGSVANSLNLKMTHSEKITLDGKYPGWEVHAEKPKTDNFAATAMRCRMYLVGKRLFTIIFTGFIEDADSPDTKKFLDSLVVTTPSTKG